MSEGHEIELELEGDGLTESAVRGHETALKRMIRENVSGAEMIERPGAHVAGAKGEPITMLIALALIKSGAAVGLLNCIKAMVVREKKLKIKVKTKDGKTIEVDATNVDSKQLRDQLADLVKD